MLLVCVPESTRVAAIGAIVHGSFDKNVSSYGSTKVIKIHQSKVSCESVKSVNRK